MPERCSRRQFLGRGFRSTCLLALAAQPASGWAADETKAPTADELTDRAVAFLRARQASDGSWSGDRKEPAETKKRQKKCKSTKEVDN